MFEEEKPVDAGQEDAADLQEEQEEVFDEEAEDADEAAEDAQEDEGEEAEPADPQPQQREQSAEDNARFAAARRDAEARMRTLQEQQDSFAQMFGYKTFEEMRQGELNARREKQVQQAVDSGMSEEMARRFYEMDATMQEQQRRIEADQREKALNEAFGEMLREFPETAQMNQLPDRVVDLIGQGKAPVDAYRQYDYERIKAENAALKQNATNKQKSPGPAKGTAPANGKKNPFLEGLLG